MKNYTMIMSGGTFPSENCFGTSVIIEAEDLESAYDIAKKYWRAIRPEQSWSHIGHEPSACVLRKEVINGKNSYKGKLKITRLNEDIHNT